MSKFVKPSSFDVIARMKELTASPTDAALARYLGVTQPALVQWRTKNIMPMAYCIEVAEKTGASLDYIYLGTSERQQTPRSGVDLLLLELVLQRRLTELGGGLAQMARRLASDYASVWQSIASRADRARLSVGAATLLLWLDDKGGQAEDVAVDAGIVNEAIRAGLLERVTTGTDGAELLVLTRAGTEFARAGL